MAARIDAYVDTSALIAFCDRSDTYHLLFRRLFASPPSLVTTPLVVAEGHAWFLRRYDRQRALQFTAMLEAMPFLQTVTTGSQDLQPAFDLLRRFSDQALTLTDALGLHVMAQRGLRCCWSTDFHLGLTGVPLIIHEH